MFVVPLKFMCSTQWDTPVCPGLSSFDPTLYQHHTDASGAVWTSCTRIFKPLSRTWDFTTGISRVRALELIALLYVSEIVENGRFHGTFCPFLWRRRHTHGSG